MQNARASELLRVPLKVTLCDQNMSAKKSEIFKCSFCCRKI